MDLFREDYKKGIVKLKVTESEDLWYLSQIIEAGDLVRGKTTRKIRLGDSDQTVKKTVTVTIQAETIEFNESGVLRINGKIKEGPEEIPRESYQSISLEINSEFVLEKQNWLFYQKEKLKEAAEKSSHYLICIFDREEALFVLTKKVGYDVLLELQGEVPKKAKTNEIKKDFREEIIKSLREYNTRFSPENIILASPAFYQEELMKSIKLPELKKKIVLTTCSSVSKNALNEVLKNPTLAEILKSNRAGEEQKILDKLLAEIKKEGLAVYGWKETKEAIASGAVQELLVSDNFIKQKREAGKFLELDEEMKNVDHLKGKIHLFSTEFESGKKLNGLGGIAALLRYKFRG